MSPGVFTLDGGRDLEHALQRTIAVPELLIEGRIDGPELTYETGCRGASSIVRRPGTGLRGAAVALVPVEDREGDTDARDQGFATVGFEPPDTDCGGQVGIGVRPSGPVFGKTSITVRFSKPQPRVFPHSFGYQFR